MGLLYTIIKIPDPNKPIQWKVRPGFLSCLTCIPGKTAIHHALCGHPNVAMAMCLKSLGTDVARLPEGVRLVFGQLKFPYHPCKAFLRDD